MNATPRAAYTIVAAILMTTVQAGTAAGQSGSPEQVPKKGLATTRTARGAESPARPSSPILQRSLSWTGAVLAAGAVVLIASRRFARNAGLAEQSSGERAKVVSRVSLTPRQSIHVVRIGDRTLVIGTGPQSAPVTLAQWSDPACQDGPVPFGRLDDSTHAEDQPNDIAAIPDLISEIKGAAA